MMKKNVLLWIVLLGAFSNLLRAQTITDSLNAVSAHWQTWEPVEGILHKRASIAHLYGGTQYINIIEIDSESGKKIDVAISDSLIKTSDLAVKNAAVAAINGSYFDMRKGNSVCFLKIDSVLKDTTTSREWKARVTGALHVYRGKLKIFPWNKQIEKNYRKKKGTVLASGPLMLLNGNECDWSMCAQDFIDTKHPRSAVAVTEKGTVLFITVDGRLNPFAAGMNIRELSHFIRVIGGKHAINLDGGGSTTLWLSNAPHAGILNCPCDNGKFDHEGERKIANILYVYD